MCRINVSGSAIQTLEVSLCVIQFSEKPITLYVWFLFSRGEMHPKREDIFHYTWHFIFLESWIFVFTLRLSAWSCENENKIAWMGGCVNQTYFRFNFCAFVWKSKYFPLNACMRENEKNLRDCVIGYPSEPWGASFSPVSLCSICVIQFTEELLTLYMWFLSVCVLEGRDAS